MVLTNYWWLLIWLAAGGGLLSIMVPKRQVQVLGKTEYRWSWSAAIFLICPYAVWCMNRKNFGDTEVYRQNFYSIPTSLGQLSAYLTENTKDQGFSISTGVLKTFIGNNDKMFFLIIAIFQLLCVVYFFRNYSKDYLMCMFMFVASTDYLSWMFNGMRQFIAVCIVLLAIGLVLKKKYIPAIAIILLASTIHGSALLMLPLIFVVQGKAWNKRTLLMILGVGLAIMFMGQFTSILDSLLAETQYSDLVTNEIWINDDGTNILRVLFYSIPMILSLVGKRFVDEENSPVINMCVNCSICTFVIYALSAASSGIYLGRLPIYTTLPGYVSCVWLIEHTFTKESARLVKIVLIGSYIVFFYYQLHIAWSVL